VKRLIISIVLSLLVVNLFYVVNAEAASSEYDGIIALCIGKSDSVVSGKIQKIDSSNTRIVAFAEKGRTFVPVRFVSEGLGAKVAWNEASQSATISSNKTTVKLSVGKKIIYVNNGKVEMDVSAIKKEGRTFIPIKYIAKALNYNIFYDDSLIILSSSAKKINSVNDKALIASLRKMITNAEEKAGDNSAKGKNQEKIEKPEMPDLSGKVTAIDDNKITLSIIKLPQSNGANREQTGSKQPPQGTGIQDQPKEQRPSQDTDIQNGAPKDRKEPPQKMNIEYTGETKVITIPSSINITTMVKTDNKMENKKIEIGDIKVGNIITLWYSDDDSTAISKVMVQTL